MKSTHYVIILKKRYKDKEYLKLIDTLNLHLQNKNIVLEDFFHKDLLTSNSKNEERDYLEGFVISAKTTKAYIKHHLSKILNEMNTSYKEIQL